MLFASCRLFARAVFWLLHGVVATGDDAPRLGAKSGDASKSLGSEFALPSAVNGLFKIILQSEVTFTLAGVRFPAGGWPAGRCGKMRRRTSLGHLDGVARDELPQ